MIREIEWHGLQQAVAEDAMKMAMVWSSGGAYERTWFYTYDPETGEPVAVRAPLPEFLSESSR